jgi:hypothetical protein
LAQAQQRLPIGLEVVAFSEEEGQRYKATFLGSGALVGQFNPAWLSQIDADGIAMRDAMKKAGLNEQEIPSIERNANNYVGFVEVHIEQGPVLNEKDNAGQYLALMLHDKKSVAGDIQFVLIEGPGKARVSAAPEAMVRAVIDRCCA